MCLGGDGVILHSSYLFKHSIPPVSSSSSSRPLGHVPCPRCKAGSCCIRARVQHQQPAALPAATAGLHAGLRRAVVVGGAQAGRGGGQCVGGARWPTCLPSGRPDTLCDEADGPGPRSWGPGGSHGVSICICLGNGGRAAAAGPRCLPAQARPNTCANERAAAVHLPHECPARRPPRLAQDLSEMLHKLTSTCTRTRTRPQVIAFNMGSMGFLTNHDFSGYKRALLDIIYGGTKLDSCTLSSIDDIGSMDEAGNSLGVMVTLRMRLSCEVWRRGRERAEQTFEVLNEMVIDRGSNSFLTNIECYEKGRFITRVQADGVMLATPTGGWVARHGPAPSAGAAASCATAGGGAGDQHCCDSMRSLCLPACLPAAHVLQVAGRWHTYAPDFGASSSAPAQKEGKAPLCSYVPAPFAPCHQDRSATLDQPGVQPPWFLAPNTTPPHTKRSTRPADPPPRPRPAGSTAYSVAAGGSMVHPNVPAILLTPVCPHSLAFRPIILPDYAELELRIPDNARCTAWVCFDGKCRQELARGDSVKVSGAGE